MSKKHFIALADQIKDQQKYGGWQFTEAQLDFFANYCQSQNHRFNRERWLDYVAGKCGPNGGKV
jgi:hypothetical protein